MRLMGMGPANVSAYGRGRLALAEQQGLRLAILCRNLGYTACLVFYVVSLLASNSAPTLFGLSLFVLMLAFGLAQAAAVGTSYDKPWLKFVLMTVDLAAICYLVASSDFVRSADLPQAMAYRSINALVLVPFLAIAALSLSPRLVLWTGGVSVLFWWLGFAVVVGSMETTVSWSDIPPNASSDEFAAVVLAPEFVGRGTRMSETLIILITAAILALAVARAKRVFLAQVRAEEEREAERLKRADVTRKLGRFVPKAIADRVMADPRALEPKVRDGAVLVMDIEGFTSYSEGRDPAEVIGELNRFLAACATRVAERHGVVITFLGDGLLATFNTPLDTDAPEEEALLAGRDLVACGEQFGFNVRVGLAAGPIAAGSVGSEERQAFTVYGDTVNRAARLEALAKSLGEALVADERVACADPELDPRGAHRLSGFSEPFPVFACKTTRRPPRNA